MGYVLMFSLLGKQDEGKQHIASFSNVPWILERSMEVSRLPRQSSQEKQAAGNVVLQKWWISPKDVGFKLSLSKVGV